MSAFKPHVYKGDVPDGPHLAVMTGSGGGFPIPVGAQMLIVIDPTKPDQIQPLLLVKVGSDKLTWRCTCNAKCKQVITMPLVRTGGHNQSR